MTRFGIVPVVALANLVMPARSARSQPPQLACAHCVPIVSGLTPTSLSIVTPYAPGGALPNATTTRCFVEYRFGDVALHSVAMTKSPNGFAATIQALGPTTVVQHRVVCDGSAGPYHSAKTLQSSFPAPTPPVVLAAKRVAVEELSFTFTGDQSEPTVFWVESRSGAAGVWQLDPDLASTFSQKRISVMTAAKATRVGVRNSAGAVYSAVVP